MFIISKLDTINNKVLIVDVEEEGDFMKAYEALLDDILQYLEKPEEFSVKNLTKSRVQVYKKGYMGSILAFVYEIHPFNEESLKIVRDEQSE